MLLATTVVTIFPCWRRIDFIFIGISDLTVVRRIPSRNIDHVIIPFVAVDKKFHKCRTLTERR